MIRIKTQKEIEAMKRGGMILSRALSDALKACVPGAKTDELDQMVREAFKEAGGEPSFLNYKIHETDTPYPSAVCISINDEVVHGPAKPVREIKDGDLVSMDAGLWFEGMATDMAATVGVGKVSDEAKDLSRETRKALEIGLEVMRAGAWVHDIGKAIESYLNPRGYAIVRDLVGHGVGYAVHEDPQIPHFHDRRVAPEKLKAGMCLAIEPMVTNGGWEVTQKADGWTIVTQDGSLAAHWEVTIVVTEKGYELITPWPNV